MRSESTSKVWYFAYGANMCSDVFIRRRGVNPLSKETAVLPNYRLVFDQAGIPWIEPCFASIAYAPGEAVHGVLYQLSEESRATVDAFEGSAYRMINVMVHGQEHGSVAALVYQTKKPVYGLKPSKRYVGLLLEGAREHALPPAYIAQLVAQPCINLRLLQPLINRIASMLERPGTVSKVLRKLTHSTGRITEFFRRDTS